MSHELLTFLERAGARCTPDPRGDVRKLKAIRSLLIPGGKFESIPASIGALAALDELSLVHCDHLVALPKTIGKLRDLRELSAIGKRLTSLPREVGALSKLRTLSIGGGLRALPKEVWKLKSLRMLALSEKVSKLPPGIGTMTSLDALYVSSRAIESIAPELPRLGKSLTTLTVSGRTKKLPEQIAELHTLRELTASYLGLRELPKGLASLTKLETLNVAGNELDSLVGIVRELPRLRTLDFSGNALAGSEKKEIDTLMRLPPAKRVRTSLATGSAKRSVAKKASHLGEIASVNAYLAMILVDAPHARAWSGTGDGAAAAGDWARARRALGARDGAVLAVGSGEGIALTLGVGHGFAQFFRVGDRITLCEVFCEEEDDEQYLAWIAKPPSPRAKTVARLNVDSGRLTALSTTDTLADGEALTFAIPTGRYTLLTESETQASWGSGRRAHLVR